MATQHVVVDGSNIATEGRSTPSLTQLEEAVAEVRKELPEAELTVVVDATFAHRIDASELERFEQAALRAEYVYPPAGAIGRGDAFLLRIAERVEGIVLSNDSFQEFHGEHEWLFERGRLLGATPVPGVGWIFVPRTPVRGPRSRVAVRDAYRAKERVVKAIAQATKEVVEPDAEEAAPRTSRRSRGRTPAHSPQAVNDPMTFISFIAEHPLGEEIQAVVDSFTSHGAVVHFGDVRCYVPLSGLGQPPPRAAREVLGRGEQRSFIVTALDPLRRGVELALPGMAVVSGRPSEETVAAEMRMARSRAKKAGAAATSAGSLVAAEADAPSRASSRRTQPKPPAEAPESALRPRRGRATTAVPASVSEASAPDSRRSPRKVAESNQVAPKIGTTKIGTTKIGATKIGATKSAATKIGATKSAATKIGATKSAATKQSAVANRTALVPKSAPTKAGVATKSAVATTSARRDKPAAVATKSARATKSAGTTKAAVATKSVGRTPTAAGTKSAGTTKSAVLAATGPRRSARKIAESTRTGSRNPAVRPAATKAAPTDAASVGGRRPRKIPMTAPLADERTPARPGSRRRPSDG